MKTIFASDMIIYVENPRESITKLTQIIKEFIKVAVCKINIKIISLHTNK